MASIFETLPATPRKIILGMASGLLFQGTTLCRAQEPQPEAGGTVVVMDSTLDRTVVMLPRWVAPCLEGLPHDVELTTRINPRYLRGDFDGDARMDYAFLVHRGRAEGVAFCFEGTPEPKLLGAGSEFHGMTNLDFDDWSVYPKGPVIRGVEEGDPPALHSDALYLLWSDRASALVYWTRSEFAWYQQGD